jgi:hypothetical protein
VKRKRRAHPLTFNTAQKEYRDTLKETRKELASVRDMLSAIEKQLVSIGNKITKENNRVNDPWPDTVVEKDVKRGSVPWS